MLAQSFLIYEHSLGAFPSLSSSEFQLNFSSQTLWQFQHTTAAIIRSTCSSSSSSSTLLCVLIGLVQHTHTLSHWSASVLVPSFLLSDTLSLMHSVSIVSQRTPLLNQLNVNRIGTCRCFVVQSCHLTVTHLLTGTLPHFFAVLLLLLFTPLLLLFTVGDSFSASLKREGKWKRKRQTKSLKLRQTWT